VKTPSIKQKLTTVIMTVTAMALVLVSMGFVVYELLTFQDRMRHDLFTQAGMVADLSETALSRNNRMEAQRVLTALARREHLTSAAIYKGSTLFAAYPPDAGAAAFPASPKPGDYSRFDYRAGNLVLFHEIDSLGGPVGAIYIKSDLGEIREQMERYAAFFIWFILATAGVTYFLSKRLQKSISEPIIQLAKTARTVTAEKNYSLRAAKQGRAELGELTDNFNEMLAQIQQRDVILHKINDNLERRVQERTRDLEGEISDRKRAEAALHEQFTRTKLLNQITHAISERQDLESVLYVVLRQLEDHLEIDLGLVCLYDREAETLNVAALRLKNPMLAGKLDLHEGMVMSLDQTGLRVCKHGESVVTPDTQKSSALLSERFAAAGFRSAAGVPLLVDGRLFGTLVVSRLAESFTASECEFLHMLSEHVALAAHQAQLHAELERAYHELRKTQQTVMQQERLRALGQMASGIAHDVNNALSPIVGFAELLARVETTLSANGRKYLQYIKTAGEDITHIVARLREFYRQRDSSEPMQSLNLNDLARQVIEMTRPRWRDIPQSGGTVIEMRTDFDANLSMLVGIESEVREALTNLILNAVDAIPNGGTITVRTRVGSRGPATPPTHVLVEVGDTGVGMDEETRKRCLEPFFSTKGQRGTGMGLAMVYGVMERHGGHIEIDSAPGRGTVMKLIFPIRHLAGAGSLSNNPEQDSTPLKILCIDDEPLLRELLREILERDGHSVRLADGGQSGVDEFRAAAGGGRPFDVVLTDLGMPYFDGRQVVNTIKRESPGTPIIMLTGWGSLMKEEGDLPDQVSGILTKPPRSNELREMLRRVGANRGVAGN
jgi:signal transduction histidine kinase/ActR/RegA family two-component response regulator/HAMP domain-containing protein